MGVFQKKSGWLGLGLGSSAHHGGGVTEWICGPDAGDEAEGGGATVAEGAATPETLVEAVVTRTTAA